MKAHFLWTLLIAASAAISGSLLACGDKPPPENGDGSGNEDDPPAPGSSFTDVYAILEARCVKCHSPKADGSAAAGNLTLTPKADAYANLINKPAGGGKCKEVAEGEAARVRVKPENSEASLLLQKLKGTHDCGDRMPISPSGATLSAAEIETIRTWIDEGALNPPSK